MRLIDADRLLTRKMKSMYYHLPNGDIAIPIIDIEHAPTVKPECRKGEWIKVGHWGRSYKCNQCGNYLDFDGVNAGRGDANFCPNCGAWMTRGEYEN